MMIFITAVEIFGCILLADFWSGFVHWLEDSYGSPDWPIIGLYVTRPNILHHYDPTHFLKGTWFGRARVLAVIVAVLICIFAFTHTLNWQILLIVGLGVNANEFHKWSHSSPSQNGYILTALQQIGIVQSSAHHAMHHKGTRDSHYCVITDYLNPILDGIKFWRGIERVLCSLGVQKRLDPTLLASSSQVEMGLVMHR